METLNHISNFLIMIGSSFFMIGVFGRKSQKIESMLFIERAFIKVSLAITAAGSLLNFMIGTVPHDSEVILNFGMGLLFVWAAYFHWKFFVKKE